MTVIQGWCLAAVVCAHVGCHLTYLLNCADTKLQQRCTAVVLKPFLLTAQYSLLHQLTEHLSPLQVSSKLIWDRGGWLLCEYYTYCILCMCKWNYFRLFIILFMFSNIKSTSVPQHTLLRTTAGESSLLVYKQHLPCMKGRKVKGEVHPITSHEGWGWWGRG